MQICLCIEYFLTLICICSNALLEARGPAEVTSSAPKPLAHEPPSTTDVDAREVELMVNTMLRDSPTPDAEEGNEKRPEETPRGKLVVPFPSFFVSSVLVFVTQEFFSRPKKSRGFYGENLGNAAYGGGPCGGV